MTINNQPKTWKPWGDHPVVVAIVVLGALIGVIVSWPTLAALFSEDEATINYFGRVIDDKTLFPIANAKVSFEFQNAPPITFTDNQGVYRFDIRSSGETVNARLRIDAEGYNVEYINISLPPSGSSLQDIRLTPISISTNPTSPQSTIASVEQTSTSVQITNTPNQVNTVTATNEPVVNTPFPSLPPATAVPTDVPIPTRRPINVLFQDTFTDDYAEEWSITEGEWRVIDGKTKIIRSNTSFATIQVGSNEWQNYSLEFETGGYFNDWGGGNNPVLTVAVRFVDQANFMYFLFTNKQIACGFRLNGEDTELKSIGGNVDTFAERSNHRIQITVIDNKYDLFVDGQQICSFNDPSFLNGGVQFRIKSGLDGAYGYPWPWLDNVKITEK